MEAARLGDADAVPKMLGPKRGSQMNAGSRKRNNDYVQCLSPIEKKSLMKLLRAGEYLASVFMILSIGKLLPLLST